MGSILRVIPLPRPVVLAKERLFASELRLRDLAQIELWLESLFPSPYDVAGGAIEAGAGTRALAWKQLLGATLDAQFDWPKTIGHPDADRAMSGREGRILVMRLSLGPIESAVVLDRVARDYDKITVAEWSKFQRVAWGNEPLKIMMDLIDGPSASDPDGDDYGVNWEGWWVKYHRNMPSGPPFADLTMSQFAAWRRDGEEYTATVDGENDPNWRAVAARRKAFWDSLGVNPGQEPV